MHARALVLSTLIASLLAGCAGVRGTLPGTAAGSSAGSGLVAAQSPGKVARVTVTAIVPHDGLPDLALAFPNLSLRRGARYVRRPLAAGSKVFVKASLIPSYASINQAAWNGIVTVGKGGSISVSFSSVVPANNEFLVLNVYSDAPYGGVYLGGLGGVFNVSAKTRALTATVPSSLLLQVFSTMLQAYLLDAADLKNAKLATSIAKLAVQQGLKPDPATGLYNQYSLRSFANAVAPKYVRMLTIDAGSNAAAISVANPPGDTPDQILVYNFPRFFSEESSSSSYYELPLGYPCVTGSGGLPGKTKIVPYICAEMYGTGSGSITVPTFHGPITIGATNGTAPWMGALQSVPESAPGSTQSVTLTLASTNLALNTDAGWYWSFGEVPGLFFRRAPGTDIGLADNAYLSMNAYDGTVLYSIPSTWSATSPSVNISTWNPWGLPITAFTACSDGDRLCQPLTSPPATLPIYFPFSDLGTNPAYYAWKASNGSTISYNSACRGYTLTPNASGVITITTTTAALFNRNQYETFAFNGFCSGAQIPADGSTILLTATDGSGNVYSGRATTAYGGAAMRVNARAPVLTTSVTLTITLAPGSPTSVLLRQIQAY